MPGDNRRRAEIVSALGAVRGRIAAACTQAGRDQRSVTLVAVTKTYPAADVLTLAQLGVLDVGESRDQEARAKRADTAELAARGDTPAEVGELAAALRWHFVGRLQSRKCRAIAGYAHSVHSLDRPELVPLLCDGVAAAGRDRLDTFVQVSLDGDPGRGGLVGDDVLVLAADVAERPELRLRGVMAIAPMDADPAAAFAALARIAARVAGEHPGADSISAGMSGDFDVAIAHGATHVRVGTALLGRRPPDVG